MIKLELVVNQSYEKMAIEIWATVDHLSDMQMIVRKLLKLNEKS